MKRILALAIGVVFATSALALAQQGKTGEAKPAAKPMMEKSMAKPAAEQPKPVSMTGEVIDLYCYMDHGAKGIDHAKCAESCIRKGLPTGFLTADGTMYVILGKAHEPVSALVAPFAGKKSTITGVVKEEGGMKGLEVVSIAETK